MGKGDNLGEFEELALLAVLRLGEEAYGARIQEELEDRVGRVASVSAIYITLTRLEGKGMVTSRLGEATNVRGGKARRFYKVEPAGIATLVESRNRLLSMWEGLQVIPGGTG